MTPQEELSILSKEILLILDCLKIYGRSDRPRILTRLYYLQKREAEIIEEMERGGK